ncbi:hypothetical protein, partial [Vibrio alginolyticus]|uniref:hypothetical protein n=1 Tax=Vibrio alginolyticus TaxID=663 RepID=UPI001A9007CB
KWQIVLYAGNEVDDCITLQVRELNHEIKTTTKTSPRPVSKVYDAINVNITPLLKCVGEDKCWSFRVNRADAKCFTPRRNR